MKITILFLGRNGAGPRYAFKMVEAISKSYPSIKLQVVLSSYIDNISDWKSIEGLELISVSTYNSSLQFFKEYLKYGKWKKIASKILGFKPDYLYIPMISLLNPLIIYHLKTIKIIYTLHDPIEHIGEKNVFVEAIRKYELKKAYKVVLLNNFFKKYVIEHYRIRENDIIEIPHAAFFSSILPKLNTEFRNKILFVGRIEKYKGVGLLIDAFSSLLEYNDDIKLTIAGKGDLSQYNKLDLLGDRVNVINGWLSDQEIDILIRDHDFVVLPYIDASQSGVVPVVFANQRIVIATDKGALKEQVPLDIGYIVEANTESIVSSILQIYESGIQNLNSRNSEAYNYALKNLTWEASAKILIDSIYG
ncbi:glycosyltransferase family 4 protein [Sphingobacterium multivorum]|uniref:glycosyltransferase family 4 protein n=1 Tax=Sphingobacterium multivorum TaxID=28454 RepID=UPI003DA293CF